MLLRRADTVYIWLARWTDTSPLGEQVAQGMISRFFDYLLPSGLLDFHVISDTKVNIGLTLVQMHGITRLIRSYFGYDAEEQLATTTDRVALEVHQYKSEPLATETVAVKGGLQLPVFLHRRSQVLVEQLML